YFISAGSGQLRSVDTGGYNLTMIEEVSNSTATDASISVGEAITSTLEYSRDQDFYAVELQSTRGYFWRMTGDGTSNATMDTGLVLTDETGAQLTIANGRSSSLLAWNPSDSGRHYIVAGINSTTGSDPGGYRLEMVEEVSSRLSTDATIEAGQTITGLLDYEGDRDMYATQLVSGASYIITLRGGSDNTPISQSDVEIFNAFGVSVGTLAVVGGTGSGVFQAEDTGTYYLGVGGGRFRDDAGSFELELSNLIFNGTASGDVLNGTVAPDVLNGLAGNDLLDGGLGNDTLLGG
ncbi:hypothetical protein RA29_21610, partial [Tateyamaria sp. ANG-S1]